MELYEISRDDAENIHSILHYLIVNPTKSIELNPRSLELKHITEQQMRFYHQVLQSLPIPVATVMGGYQHLHPIAYTSKYMQKGGFLSDWNKSLENHNRKLQDLDLQRRQAEAGIKASIATEKATKYAKYSLWVAIFAVLISAISILLQVL